MPPPTQPYVISGTAKVSGRSVQTTVEIYLNNVLQTTLTSDTNGDFSYVFTAWSVLDIIRVEIVHGEYYRDSWCHRIRSGESYHNFGDLETRLNPVVSRPFKSVPELNEWQLDQSMLGFPGIMPENAQDQVINIRPISADIATASERIYFGSAIERDSSDESVKLCDGTGMLGIADYDIALENPYYDESDSVSFIRRGLVKATVLPQSRCRPGQFVRVADNGLLTPEHTGSRSPVSVATVLEEHQRSSDYYQLVKLNLF